MSSHRRPKDCQLPLTSAADALSVWHPQIRKPALTRVAARIAIVDDEPINIKVARKHLQNVGYQQLHHHD